jgi:hypothetical protein
MTEIRPLAPSDESAWRDLWRGYLEFYETELPEEIYATSFARLVDPAVTDYHGLVALQTSSNTTPSAATGASCAKRTRC